jgi:hypothetical protein
VSTSPAKIALQICLNNYLINTTTMSSFQKGHKPHPGVGRPKGSKGVKGKQWEAFVQFCAESGLEKLQKELLTLEGKDYVYAFAMLLEFHRPKLARTEIVGDSEQPLEQRVTFVIKNERNEVLKQIDVGSKENELPVQDAEVIKEETKDTEGTQLDNLDYYAD